jgi:hypothetical protein
MKRLFLSLIAVGALLSAYQLAIRKREVTPGLPGVREVASLGTEKALPSTVGGRFEKEGSVDAPNIPGEEGLSEEEKRAEASVRGIQEELWLSDNATLEVTPEEREEMGY